MSDIETYNKEVEFGLINNPYNWHIWKKAYRQGAFDKEKDRQIQELKQEVLLLTSKNLNLELELRDLHFKLKMCESWEK